MSSTKNFRRTAAKIEELRTAIFSDFSASLVKFPTSIVRILSANEEGEIWLSLPRPYPDISGMEKKFRVELNFYNKEYDFYINVGGIAELVSPLSEIPGNIVSLFKSLIDKDLVICIKMDQADYHHKAKMEKAGLLEAIPGFLKWRIPVLPRPIPILIGRIISNH